MCPWVFVYWNFGHVEFVELVENSVDPEASYSRATLYSKQDISGFSMQNGCLLDQIK